MGPFKIVPALSETQEPRKRERGVRGSVTEDISVFDQDRLNPPNLWNKQRRVLNWLGFLSTKDFLEVTGIERPSPQPQILFTGGLYGLSLWRERIRAYTL